MQITLIFEEQAESLPEEIPSMSKTFTHIGVATYKNQKPKFRFTRGRAEARIKTMTKEGFTNIEFLALPGEMTKAEAFATDVARELSARHSIAIPTAAEQVAESVAAA
jgi:hypothetical protein